MKEVSFLPPHQHITSIYRKRFLYGLAHPAAQIVIALSFPHKLDEPLPLHSLSYLIFARVYACRVIRHASTDTNGVYTTLYLANIAINGVGSSFPGRNAIRAVQFVKCLCINQ